MIIEDARTRILRVFSENWFRELTIEELISISGLGRTWLYKNLNELIKAGLVRKKAKTYSANMDNLLMLSLKQTFDLEKLYSLEKGILNEILSVFDYFKSIDINSFLVVGSTARLKRTKKSDIDFLIIARKKEFEFEPKTEANIILLTLEEFERKYLECDDFVLTCLAHGLIIYDNNFILEFLRKPLPFPAREQIESKRNVIRKSMERVYKLLEIDDISNANKELKNVLTQLARISILEEGEIPLSRGELIVQTKDKFIKEALKLAIRGRLTKDKIIDLCEGIEELI